MEETRPPQFTIRRLLFLVAVAAGLSWLLLTGPISYSEFLAVETGMTKDQVAAILGRPEWFESRKLNGEERERWCYSEHRIGFDYYQIEFHAKGKVALKRIQTTLSF